MKINVGCGMSPTPGWRNFDNSPALKLSRWPVLAGGIGRLGMLSRDQKNYIEYCAKNAIEYADARHHIPVPDESVDALYSSHMLEHLARDDAGRFLKEALRVLKRGGVLRIAVPDLKYYVDKYAVDADLEYFMEYLHLSRPPPRGWRQKLQYLVVGDRHHQWMYDGPHLCKVLAACGYAAPAVLTAGTTTIVDPGALDLRERFPESLYVEARKP